MTNKIRKKISKYARIPELWIFGTIALLAFAFNSRANDFLYIVGVWFSFQCVVLAFLLSPSNEWKGRSPPTWLYHFTTDLNGLTNSKIIQGRTGGRVYLVDNINVSNLGVSKKGSAANPSFIAIPFNAGKFQKVRGWRWSWGAWKRRRGEWVSAEYCDLHLCGQGVPVAGGIEFQHVCATPQTGKVRALSVLRRYAASMILVEWVGPFMLIALLWLSASSTAVSQLEMGIILLSVAAAISIPLYIFYLRQTECFTNLWTASNPKLNCTCLPGSTLPPAGSSITTVNLV